MRISMVAGYRLLMPFKFRACRASSSRSEALQLIGRSLEATALIRHQWYHRKWSGTFVTVYQRIDKLPQPSL